MSKTIDALKTAIESMAKTIEELRAKVSSLESENSILKGKLAIAEMKKENLNPINPIQPYQPSFPTYPSPTWPTNPIWPNKPNYPWMHERTITWDNTNPPNLKPYMTSVVETALNAKDIEKMEISCHLQ